MMTLSIHSAPSMPDSSHRQQMQQQAFVPSGHGSLQFLLQHVAKLSILQYCFCDNERLAQSWPFSWQQQISKLDAHMLQCTQLSGAVACAGGAEGTNASQFYITTGQDLDSLDGKHTIFGEVSEGLDVLQQIDEAFVDDAGRPLQNIRWVS